MLATLLERVTVISDEQPLQKPYGMATTPLGRDREINFEQSQKAKTPKLTELLGILIVTREEQLSKALIPKLVTLPRRLTVVNAEQW
jgi:hypothetical protein